MPIGPGKYDRELTRVRAKLNAAGGILVIVGGDKGPGFSAHLTPEMALAMPGILRHIAAEIEASTHGST